MHPPELEYLYQLGKKHKRIVEIGSWFGRSTHALLSGAATHGGTVVAVDHFKGTASEFKGEHRFAAEGGDVYSEFMKNCGQFPNLRVLKMGSVEASQKFDDESIDCVFLDAEHEYESVLSDLTAWWPKVRVFGSLCGHDIHWQGVQCGLINYFKIFPHHVSDGTIWSIKKLKRRLYRDEFAPSSHPVIIVYDAHRVPRAALQELQDWLIDEPRSIDSVTVPVPDPPQPIQVFDLSHLSEIEPEKLQAMIEDRLFSMCGEPADIKPSEVFK